MCIINNIVYAVDNLGNYYEDNRIMKITDLTTELRAELRTLAVNPHIDITTIRGSAFYLALQGKTELSTRDAGLNPGEKLLVARIAASIPTISKIDMFYSEVGLDAPVIARALAASPYIHTIDLSYNPLGYAAILAFRALSASPHLHTLKLQASIGSHTASEGIVKYDILGSELAALPHLGILDLSNNNLGYHASTIVRKLAVSPRLHTLDISYNKIEDYVNTALAFESFPTICTVLMKECIATFMPAPSIKNVVCDIFSAFSIKARENLSGILNIDESITSSGLPIPVIDLIGEYVSSPIEVIFDPDLVPPPGAYYVPDIPPMGELLLEALAR